MKRPSGTVMPFPGQYPVSPVAELTNISFAYSQANILDGISLRINTGESYSVTGSSGSGKSTLLSILGLLEHPSSGQYRLCGHDVLTLDSNTKARLRNHAIGFIFQSFHLLPTLDAAANVALPLLYRGYAIQDARRLALEELARVELSGKASHYPADLSGGQRQRVAIARALITRPALLLADEPTGNLDSSTTHTILTLLLSLHRALNMAMIVVTHDLNVAALMQHPLKMTDGQLHGA